jgi:SAM-dependent methyltransferase
MRLDQWDTRYRSREKPDTDFFAAPTPLLVNTVEKLAAGTALDIACGTGRNSLWLAERGWNVTAVDGAAAAIEVLQQRARERKLTVVAKVADLERGEFRIEPQSWDLIAKCYYLQRSLMPDVCAGVRPGGLAIVIVHIVEDGEDVTPTRAALGELRGFFADWEILHYFEGRPSDTAHKRAAAEIVARRP